MMDERMRTLGRRVRDEAADPVDVDRAWAEQTARQMSAPEPEDERAPSWRWLAIAATVAALVVGAGVLLLRDDPGRLQTADDPVATPFLTAPPTTVSPPTTATSSVVSTTTSQTPSTAVRGSTQAPAPEPKAWRGFPWERGGIARDCVSEYLCTQVRLSPSGTMISYDPGSHTLTRHSTSPATLDLPDTYREVWIEAVGPHDVAYLGIDADGELGADLVAVPTATGGFAEIARWRDLISVVGDMDLVAAPDGLVDVGCCGEELVRPEPTDELVVEWLDPDGNVARDAMPSIVISRDSTTSYTIRRDDHSWDFDAPVEITARSMQVVATHDGGVLAAFGLHSGLFQVVVRGWPAGTVDVVFVDTTVAALDPAGVAVIADDDGFARVELFPRRDDDWTGGRVLTDDGSVTFPGLDEYVANASPTWAADPVAFAHALAGRMAVNETRTIEPSQVSESAWTVTVTTSNLFDDSIAAVRLELELGRSGTGILSVETGTWSQVCQPGRGQEDFSATLCV
jgi:hypothetical protein